MFRFRLERLLELRALREQEKAAAVAEARTATERALAARASLVAVRAASAEALLRAHEGGTVGQLQNLGLALARIDEALSAAGDAARAAEAELDGRREELRAAMRDRRVLDRLKEHHAEQWRADTSRTDQQLMDAIALARHHHTSTPPCGEEPVR